ncbi:MAG: calcium/sodium antiporter [DPANN group archaeon]|nr:calcium/sodium antiporter [DPANN group archaeon]
MLFDLFIFIISLVILVKATDVFVDSAALLAKFFGVSELLIGLTVVAFGTSLPELGSSVAATLLGNYSIALGNIIGSNIANIALVIGSTALFSTILLNKVAFFRDGLFMLGVSVLFYLLALDGSISGLDALILLAFLAYYLFLLYRWEGGKKESFSHEIKVIDFFNVRWILDTFGFTDVFRRHIAQSRRKKKTGERLKQTRKGINIWMHGPSFLLSGVLIYLSAKYLIVSASQLATAFGISSAIVGLSAVAIGTSLPELTVSIVSVIKGHGSLLVGNIIGSNIANLLVVGSVAALIHPLTLEPSLLWIALPAMLLFSLLFLVIMRVEWKFGRREGILFLFLYGLLFYVLLH